MTYEISYHQPNVSILSVLYISVPHIVNHGYTVRLFNDGAIEVACRFQEKAERPTMLPSTCSTPF